MATHLILNPTVSTPDPGSTSIDITAVFLGTADVYPGDITSNDTFSMGITSGNITFEEGTSGDLAACINRLNGTSLFVSYIWLDYSVGFKGNANEQDIWNNFATDSYSF